MTILSKKPLTLGQVMLDLDGLTVTDAEQQLIAHPQTGGIILFSRNYQNKRQLQQLIQQIRQIKPEILIAVDHEGGRVQRFREEFTAIPPAQFFGQLYDQDPTQALQQIEQAAWTIATELQQVDIDLCFAPVLDIQHNISSVIGDRSLHANPEVVIVLGRAFIAGLKRAGMAAVAKHFPGHGGVQADSHIASPIDQRSYAGLATHDLLPFQTLIAEGLLGIMPAHVIYPAIDTQPASLSAIWLQQILRQQLNFKGVIFSDDLTMHGASVAGDYLSRARAALAAGCDMILVCNNRAGAIEILAALHDYSDPIAQQRLAKLSSLSLTQQQ